MIEAVTTEEVSHYNKLLEDGNESLVSTVRIFIGCRMRVLREGSCSGKKEKE
jgi:hypothetical protein